MPTTNESTVADCAELEQFLKIAAPGERCRYHRGLLAHDRDIETRDGKMMVTARVQLNALAEMAMLASHAGLVRLVQERAGEECEYLAVRTTRAVN